MNPYEIDVMKLTPEDYLKMRDRCRELEDKKKQQADCILKLETELSQFRVAMKESSERRNTGLMKRIGLKNSLRK